MLFVLIVVVWCVVCVLLPRYTRFAIAPLFLINAILTAGIVLKAVTYPGVYPWGLGPVSTTISVAAIWVCWSWGRFRRDAAEVQQKVDKPTGFVVENVHGLYLDRYFRWRKHAGVHEAYVHSIASLLSTGDGGWMNHVCVMYQARYNKEADSTELVDPSPLSVAAFLFEYGPR